MMKFTLALFAVLAVVGLGQAHQFPNFGEGPLHEDIQDILDLVPMQKIYDVSMDYWYHDREVQFAVKYLGRTTHIRDLWVGLQDIPEFINLLNYLYKEDVDMYYVVNAVNRQLKVKELVPPIPPTTPTTATPTTATPTTPTPTTDADTTPVPSTTLPPIDPDSHVYSTIRKRIGGIRGLLQEIKNLFNYDLFIDIYVHKSLSSVPFVDFINHLKSDNFQQLIDKVHEIKSFEFMVNALKKNGAAENVRLTANIMYIVLGITVPIKPAKSLYEELADFMELIPVEAIELTVKYINEDEQIQKAIQFLLTSEFHEALRSLEALKEFKELVKYLQNVGLLVVEFITEFHKAIGMEPYVPPTLKSFLEGQLQPQEVGDGMKGLLKDLKAILPMDKFGALHEEKVLSSQVFDDFVAKMHSPRFLKLVKQLRAHKTYKEFIQVTLKQGLELEEYTKLTISIFGFKSAPYVMF